MIFGVLYSCFAAGLLWILGWVLPSFVIEKYNFVACSLLSLILIYNIFPYFKKWCFNSRVLPHKKAVLITGCDSGFGHALAKRLDSKGFLVFASCLFPEGEGAKELKTECSSRLHVLGLDVTKDESVKSALEYVQHNLGDCKLWAVVNNAGVSVGYNVSCSKLEFFKICLDVNTMGPVRVTKAFLPLLRRSKGRVVTVASRVGRIAFPGVTPYTMSKFATVAFSECLRLELQPWGVKVISIEPEGFKTGMTSFESVSKNIEDLVYSMDEETKLEHGEAYFESVKENLKNLVSMFSEKSFLVVDSLEEAISLEQPDNVYQPCRNCYVSLCLHVLQHLPKPVQDEIILFSVKFLFPLPTKADKTL